jgi:hypothetical protein
MILMHHSKLSGLGKQIVRILYETHFDLLPLNCNEVLK